MLVGLCGSLRKESANRKLMRDAARLYGGDFVEADIRFPLFDEDLENREGVPDAVVALAETIKAAEAAVIATPEYNQSMSGVLKNALDWLSRTKLSPWRDKPVAIVSAAAGRAGGARAQYALRLAMNPFRPKLLTGPEVLVADGRNQFDEAGRLTQERNLAALEELMASLRATARG